MSNIHKQIGRITTITPQESGTSKKGKEWTKQVVVISYQVEGKENTFEKHLAAEAFNKDLGNLQVGQQVELAYAVDSREYNGRWYTNVSFIGAEVKGATPQNTQTPTPASIGNEDLPF